MIYSLVRPDAVAVTEQRSVVAEVKQRIQLVRQIQVFQVVITLSNKHHSEDELLKLNQSVTFTVRDFTFWISLSPRPKTETEA